jgi:phosphoribosyl-ATP pyrophosphohydrolase
MFSVEKVFSWLSLGGFLPTTKKQMLVHELIEEERLELLEAQTNNNRKEMLDAYVDLFWVVTNGLYYDGFTTEEFMAHANKVESQNFSKYCKTEEEALETIKAYKEGTHPNKMGVLIEATYRKNRDYYIILRSSDHKILKSINYVEEVN